MTDRSKNISDEDSQAIDLSVIAARVKRRKVCPTNYARPLGWQKATSESQYGITENKEERNERNEVMKEAHLLEACIARSPSSHLETFKLCQPPLTFYANSDIFRPYGISSVKMICDKAYLIVSMEESGILKSNFGNIFYVMVAQNKQSPIYEEAVEYARSKNLDDSLIFVTREISDEVHA
ncbi:hypothetical protein ROZALSC1DRAFT_25460 [Rozella allomycis CSF55]|uniref:Uncharacterized protein n=1 Tax=Rozella allomycis (strain CSF55) TaxID=988480 RepID=A0A4P9YDK5_ROZAC|nr:hypothetical protein ROZALSC1DRAFT_25460 [Rozella allomycis CSF55]